MALFKELLNLGQPPWERRRPRRLLWAPKSRRGRRRSQGASLRLSNPQPD